MHEIIYNDDLITVWGEYIKAFNGGYDEPSETHSFNISKIICDDLNRTDLFDKKDYEKIEEIILNKYYS
jgi:hypothetical protein